MAEPKAKTLQMKLGFFDEDLKKPMHDDILKWINADPHKFLSKIYPHFPSWNEKKIDFLKNYCDNIIQKNINELNNNITKNSEKIETYKKSLDENNKEHYEYLILERENENKLIAEKINSIKNSLDLNELPDRNPIKITDLSWEFPVTSQSKSTTGYVSSKNLIGFIDLKLTFEFSTLTVTGIDFIEKKVIDKIQWKQSEKEIDYKSGYEYFENCKETLYIEVKTEIKSLGELFRQLQTYKTYINGNFVVVCPDDKEKQIIKEQGFIFVKYE